MKKALVLLLCALAVFAIVSCKQDPPAPETFKVTFETGTGATQIDPVTVEKDAKVAKPADPTKLGSVFGGWFTEAACTNEYNFDTPVTKAFTLYAKWTVLPPAKIAKMTVTTGIGKDIEKNSHDKVQFNIDLKDILGEKGGIEKGDVLTLKFRTSRDIYQYDIRTNKKTIDKETGEAASKDVRWVYETYRGTLADPVLGEDGWYTLTYTFSDDYYKDKDKLEYDKYQYYNLGLNFRGYLLTDDIFEIKDVVYTRGDHSYAITMKEGYNAAASFISFAEVENHEWTIPKTQVLVYFADSSDKYPLAESVAKGGVPQGLKETGYKFEYFSDSGKTTAFDMTAAVEKDVELYVTKTALPQYTVTFDSEGGSDVEPATVYEGSKVDEPEEPTLDGNRFDGWFIDETFDDDDEYDFDTPVTEDFTLFAKWVELVDVSFDLNYEDAPEPAVVVIDEGDTVDEPENPVRPGFYFGGWFTDDKCAEEDAFDFDTVLDEDITLYAKWTEPETVYSMVAVRGGSDSADKFILDWTGDPGKLANGEDVIAFKYRSTVDFNQFNVRGAKKWVYERELNDSNLEIYEVGDDGWISVAYRFTPQGGSYDDGGGTIDYGENGLKFRFDLRASSAVGGIAEGDLFEVKGISFNGEELKLQAVGSSSSGCVADSFKEIAPDVWPETVAVTFNYDNGGEADPRTGAVDVEFGVRATKIMPEDTTKGSLVFMGWFTDEACTEAFDSNVPVLESFTLYGKWIEAFAVTLHNFDGSKDRVDYVGKNVPMDEPRGVGNAGYFLEGWYSDSALTTKWDFEANVVDDMDLYAKWILPTEAYQFTSTVEETRWQFRWHEDTIAILNGDIQAGDVFTLMVKFDGNNTLAENYWRLRTRSGEKHITEDVKFSKTTKDEDGWYLITVTVPDTITDSSGLYLQIYGTSEAKWPEGSVMILKALAMNGKAIEVDARKYGTASTHKGAYEKVCADGLVVNPDGSPKAE